MQQEVYIAHADGDEVVAKRLAERLKFEGFEVQCRAFLRVGESYIAQENNMLRKNCPVVLCGTCRAAGSSEAHNLINAARASGTENNTRVFPVKIEKDARLSLIVPIDIRVADCSIDYESGLKELIDSIKAHYPLNPKHQVLHNRNEVNIIPFLDEIIPEARPDWEAIKRFRSDMRADMRVRFPPDLSGQEFLRRCGTLQDGSLTRAGVLMFGEYPDLIMPHAVCHCSVYSSTNIASIVSTFKIFGTIPNQIQKIYDLVASKIGRRERIVPGSMKSEEIFEYPMVALREIIANALVHRDYEDKHRKIHLRIFPDRIEVANPGVWNGNPIKNDSSSLAIDQLISESVNKNQRLASIISWTKLFEGEGTGLPKSVEECKKLKARIPEVNIKNNFVLVDIFLVPFWDVGPNDVRVFLSAVRRVFLSAVTDEFRAYRDQLRTDLTRHNVEVRVPEDFKDLGSVTLDKLDVYIKACDAVVHLVGDMTGANVREQSTKAIFDKYPDLPGKLPPLGEALDKGIPISYTQWEAWLALYHGKVLLIAKADDASAARSCLCADRSLPRRAEGASCETSRR